MTDEKIREVLARYEERLATTPCLPFQSQLVHCQEMIPKIRVFLDEGRRDKAFRWLGFMQGVFWSSGLYTIEEMADHNRPRGEDGNGNTIG